MAGIFDDPELMADLRELSELSADYTAVTDVITRLISKSHGIEGPASAFAVALFKILELVHEWAPDPAKQSQVREILTVLEEAFAA
jgi:hypothetical protein